MDISRDYEELFRILNDCKIKYLVVGAYAVIFYSEPRYTKDIDIWINPEVNDVKKIYQALKKFGAPLTRMSPDDFKDRNMIFQIGVAPVRIDIMMNLPGVSFELAWKNRKKTHYGKTPINILGIFQLIQAKKRAKRAQDKIDLERLLQVVRYKRK